MESPFTELDNYLRLQINTEYSSFKDNVEYTAKMIDATIKWDINKMVAVLSYHLQDDEGNNYKCNDEKSFVIHTREVLYNILNKILDYTAEGKITSERATKRITMSIDRYSKKYPFLINYKNRLITDINKLTQEDRLIESTEIFSFKFLHNEEKILPLYKLLSDANLIEADKQEFINAFSEKKVTTGVIWLCKARNKQVNKKALFTFIKRLETENIIKVCNMKNQVGYVFRDGEGNLLKNLDQSYLDSLDEPSSEFNKTIEPIIQKFMNSLC